jgi:transcriptional regulator with XRE-family HTH domain
MTKLLGQEIKRLRREADMTLRAFATAARTSPAHQSDIEHGRRLPSDELLRRIADKLAHVGGSYEQLKRLDGRIDPELSEWIKQTPEAGQMLREVRDSKKLPRNVLEKLRELLGPDEEEDK